MSAENKPEKAALAEAVGIDAELRELRSFVSTETRHAPTVRAVNDLRRRVARAFGHTDLWCVEHCAPGCGQHRRRSTPPGASS